MNKNRKDTCRIKVTEMLSDLDNYAKLQYKLWVTPNSLNPYWASNVSFTYDIQIADPWDFLEASGYDCFDEEVDYEQCDESVTLLLEYMPL